MFYRTNNNLLLSHKSTIMLNKEIIIKWLKEETNYIEYYGMRDNQEDDLSMVTMDGLFDFDKLIEMLELRDLEKFK